MEKVKNKINETVDNVIKNPPNLNIFDKPETKTNNKKKFIMVTLIILIIIIIAVVIYRKIRKSKTKPVFLKTPTTGKESFTLPSNNIKPGSNNYSCSFHVFIYIQDFDYRYGSLKTVFTKGEPDYACPGLYLAPKINNAIVKIYTDQGMKTFTVPDLEVKKWVHIAICLKGGEVDLYYQGKLVITGLLGNNCKLNNESINIGGEGGFNGLLYQLNYNPDFLSAKQIAKLAKKKPPVNAKYFK